MTTEASSEFEVEEHRRALQAARGRAVYWLGFVTLLLCIPWLLGQPWLLIALVPLAPALPRLVRMILHPQLPQSGQEQEVIAETLHRQLGTDSASAPVAEQLVEIQEKLDALELRVPGQWKVPFIGKLVGPLGMIATGGLALLTLAKGYGVGDVLFPAGLACLFGGNWWFTARQERRRERRREEAKTLLTEERELLVATLESVHRPAVGQEGVRSDGRSS
jgi:hypothetical protein